MEITTITISYKSTTNSKVDLLPICYKLPKDQALECFYNSDFITFHNIDPAVKVVSIQESNDGLISSRGSIVVKYIIPGIGLIVLGLGAIFHRDGLCTLLVLLLFLFLIAEVFKKFFRNK